MLHWRQKIMNKSGLTTAHTYPLAHAQNLTQNAHAHWQVTLQIGKYCKIETNEIAIRASDAI